MTETSQFDRVGKDNGNRFAGNCQTSASLDKAARKERFKVPVQGETGSAPVVAIRLVMPIAAVIASGNAVTELKDHFIAQRDLQTDMR